jgi:C4-dicarboxylate-specific signal transduction histidine kinase
VIWAEAHLAVVRDETGRSVGMRGVTMDITARKMAEEALQQARAELAYVSRVTTVGEMAASIAHEVNQPLAAVVTNGNACLRWLAGAAPNQGEACQAVERIIRDANRASKVIGQIRALFDKTPRHKDWVEVDGLIAEVIALTDSELFRNRVTVRTELAPDLPPVLGDGIQLQQVIMNLILNGAEAMSTATDRPRELFIAAQRNSPEEVLVVVRDSGAGLDPQDLDRIFDAFYTTKPKGMGMGLSISRSIIESHGGRLWAARNEEHGATFQFTLPVGGKGLP